jgi:hypothetical protein
MAPNISDLHYEACWTENDGLYGCGCRHETIADAIGCVIGDGKHFVRAVEGGVSRSLNEEELREFVLALVRRVPAT